jgi:hypothetical protein
MRQPPGLRRATADGLPAITADINAAYARDLTRTDKPPACGKCAFTS